MGLRALPFLLGWLELLAGVATAILWRSHHAPSIPQMGDDYQTAQAFIHGASHLLVFLLLTPTGWLVDWLFLEGLARVVASAMGQPLGTAPLAIARFARARLRREPAPPADLVERSGDTIAIESACDHRWDHATTVELDGALYQVERAPGRLRRFRFVLRPVADGHLVRSPVRYPPATSSRKRP